MGRLVDERVVEKIWNSLDFTLEGTIDHPGFPSFGCE